MLPDPEKLLYTANAALRRLLKSL